MLRPVAPTIITKDIPPITSKAFVHEVKSGPAQHQHRL